MSMFRGTGVALVTPFDAQGAVDVPALKRIVEHVITGGVEVLVALGTTGESVTLSEEEQHLVIRTVLEVNAGRCRTLLGCGGNNTYKLLKTQEEYQKLYPEADGFLSVTPYYNRPTQQGLYEHYSLLAKHSSKPIVLYNVPARTGSNLLPETVLRLAHDHKNIVAVKEASGSVEQGMAIIKDQPEGFHTLSGDDILALPSIACGYDGVISVVGNVAPGPYSSLVCAALNGDYELARKLHYQLLPLMQANFAEGNPAGIKAALAALGICRPDVRLPLVAASAQLQAKMKELVPASMQEIA
jgi:4-hydroxy-tetrahydrodipicolinate synthase